MRLNTAASAPPPPKTHQGAPGPRLDTEQKLARSVLACLLWERQFYENGVDIADRITDLAGRARPSFVADLAVKARTEQNLRHAPLLLLSVLARTRPAVNPVNLPLPPFPQLPPDRLPL